MMDIQKISDENPDLSRECIQDLLRGLKQIAEGKVSPYDFGPNKK